MEAIFKIQERIRGGVLHNLNSLPFEKLIAVPVGFSNNILWNAGHIISVQQSLVYGLTGNHSSLDTQMLTKFKKGSFPDLESAEQDLEWIKEYIESVIQKTKKDYEAGLFLNVPRPYTTMLMNEITTVEDCFQMAVFHDSIHFDRIRAFKRMLS